MRTQASSPRPLAAVDVSEDLALSAAAAATPSNMLSQVKKKDWKKTRRGRGG
eukprot:m.84905 g.84905  ORF g.84905 m.84905 type:complete len:52 (-) comp14821_c0_seq3:121-276(-)